MCFSGPSTPSVPPPDPKPATTKDTTEAVAKVRDNQKTKAAAALGQAGTILTSPFGVTGAAQTTNKSLLGA